MGKSTDANRRELENAPSFEDAHIEDMVNNHFPQTLNDLIQKKNVSVQEIVNNSSVSKSYINKLRNFKELNINPSRHKIIDIGLALNSSEAEMNELLKAAGLQPLYARKEHEALIIWGLMHGLNGKEIRNLLYKKGFDSIFHDK